MKRLNFKFKLEVREGAMIPKYYGIAYLEIDRLIAVAYPVPFNLVIGVFRKIWNWIRVPEGLFKSGYDNGYLKGKEEGRKYAFDQVKKQIIKGEVQNIIEDYHKFEQEALEAMRTGKPIDGWIRDFIEKQTKRLDS